MRIAVFVLGVPGVGNAGAPRFASAATKIKFTSARETARVTP
jgi:hypothetical protein